MQNGDGRLGRRDRHHLQIGGEGSMAIWSGVIWRHFHHISRLVMCFLGLCESKFLFSCNTVWAVCSVSYCSTTKHKQIATEQFTGLHMRMQSSPIHFPGCIFEHKSTTPPRQDSSFIKLFEGKGWRESEERGRKLCRPPLSLSLTTGFGLKVVPRLRECCGQGQAEVVSNCRNKIQQTWGPPFSRAL